MNTALRAGALTVIIFLIGALSVIESSASEATGSAPLSFAERRPESLLDVSPDKIVKCESAKEFRDSFLILSRDKTMSFTPQEATALAVKLSSGCLGAGRRFVKVLYMLTASGFDQKKSREVAVDLALYPDFVAETFVTIFPGVMADDLLGVNYQVALQLSVLLAKTSPKQSPVVQRDFVSLTQFCKSKENLLPVKECAEIILALAPYSQVYKEGLYPKFVELFDLFSGYKTLRGSLRTTLPLIVEVLQAGPFAQEAFKESLEFILGKDGPELAPARTLEVAKRVAKNSILLTVEESEK